MDHFLTVLREIWTTKSLRDKILFTIFMLVILRFAAHVTMPGIDAEKLLTALDNQQRNAATGLLSLLTGGATERFSIVLMGLTPYINASIIMQLLAVVVPSLENLKKEGEAGQKKINQYTRLLTVPLAFVQSWGMISLINNVGQMNVIEDVTDFSVMLPMMLIATVGTMFLVWLGELITEKGIGNGISLLIFAGIVATVPTQIYGAYKASNDTVLSPVFLGLVLATILLTLFVVYVSEADRRVPVVYAAKKSGAQQKSFLPLKINQAGMIPIIFAVSIVSVPSILARFLAESESEVLQSIASFASQWMDPNSPNWFYNLLYASLIIGFTYFYISIVFEPKKIADNIQKRGGFIPGYRPGSETEKFLDNTMNRLSFWGSLFLAFVAIFPLLFQSWMGKGTQSVTLFISGAGIIIVVGVVLDIIRRINAQLVMHDYEKL